MDKRPTTCTMSALLSVMGKLKERERETTTNREHIQLWETIGETQYESGAQTVNGMSWSR